MLGRRTRQDPSEEKYTSVFKEAKLGKEKLEVFPETRMRTLTIVKCSDMICSVYT